MITSRRRSFFRVAACLVIGAFFVWFFKVNLSFPLLRSNYKQKMALLRRYWNWYAGLDDVINTRLRTCKRHLATEAIQKPAVKMRTFRTHPVRIYNADTKSIVDLTSTCAVPCLHHPGRALPINQQAKPDATFERLDFNAPGTYGILRIYRTMESSTNVPASSFVNARTHYDIVMTPSLQSHVPVPYYSWVMHDFMKPLTPKPRDAEFMASAFISNCLAQSFRLAAIKVFSNLNVTVNFLGRCSPRSNGIFANDNKGNTIRQYKFHFAFENSVEIDYVTEKFYESLIEGTVPVVIGAPNIKDFEPANNSVLYVKSLEDVQKVAKKMLKLVDDEKAYNEMLAWKKTGPSNKFKALVDLAVVHSACRLCIHVADVVRQKEDCLYFPKEPPCHQSKDVGYRLDDQEWMELLNRSLPGNETRTTSTPADESRHHQTSSNRTTDVKRVRPCNCFVEDDLEPESSFDVHLLRVRERGLFEFFNIFLDSRLLTVSALHREILSAFQSLRPHYQPIWTAERDDKGHQVVERRPSNRLLLLRRLSSSNFTATSGSNATLVPLRIHRVYPVGASQRAALYEGLSLDSNKKVANFVRHRPCGRLEVIFV